MKDFSDTASSLIRHDCGLSPSECQQYHRAAIAKEDEKLAALTAAHQAAVREELEGMKNRIISAYAYTDGEDDQPEFWALQAVSERIAELQASQSEKGEE